MARLLGYMANRADRLRDVLEDERSVISRPLPARPTGWGIGFYQGGEVLHKKRPVLEGKSLEWSEVAADVRSDCAVFHLRQATVGDFRSENTHPFRMRRWIFAHNGTIERFDAIKPSLLRHMPDFLRRNIRGDTDSEHFFHVILAHLHEAVQLDTIDVDENVVREAIRKAVALVDSLTAEQQAEKSTLNMILTNGRRMFAFRRGAPMAFVERHGTPEARDDVPVDPRAPSVLRYVLIVSDGPDAPPAYRALDDGQVLTVDRNLETRVDSL